jgi:outer membrane protein
MKKLSLLGLCLLSTMTYAQSAGSWLLQGGITHLAPNVSSGALSAPSPAGTTVDVGSDTRLTGQISYIYDDHWAVAVPFGTGFKHKLYGDGSMAGVGQVGSVRALPITVMGQYRWNEPEAVWRPYATAGLTYARFYDEQGSAALNANNPANPPGGKTGLSVDSKWAPNIGLGVTMRLDDKWFMDVAYVHSFLKTTTHLSTGQSLNIRLDPDMFNLSIGTRY